MDTALGAEYSVGYPRAGEGLTRLSPLKNICAVKGCGLSSVLWAQRGHQQHEESHDDTTFVLVILKNPLSRPFLSLGKIVATEELAPLRLQRTMENSVKAFWDDAPTVEDGSEYSDLRGYPIIVSNHSIEDFTIQHAHSASSISFKGHTCTFGVEPIHAGVATSYLWSLKPVDAYSILLDERKY